MGKKKIYRFGESILYRHHLLHGSSSLIQKIRFFLLGHNFIGAEIRLSHLKKALQKIPTVSVALDAGCGTGDFSFYIAQRYPDTSLFSYDIAFKIIQENKGIQQTLDIKNITFANVNLLQLQEREKYDFIFSIGTLIYFSKKETKKILENMTTALKKGGYLYLDLPKEDFLEINYIPTKYYPHFYAALKSENSGDLYTFDEMKKLLDTMCFDIIHATKSFSYTGKFAWEFDNMLREHGFTKIRYFFLPFLKLLAIIDGMTKHKKGCCFVILGRKR